MAGTRHPQPRSWTLSWPSRAARRARRHRGRLRSSLGVQQLEPRIAFAIAPTLVADLNTIPVSSYPEIGDGFGATAAGLVFLADDHVHGREFWVSDGSADGTKLLKDASPGPGDSSFVGASPVFNGAYYALVRLESLDPWGPTPTQLWKTDGTPAGTVLVKELAADGYQSTQGFAVFAGKLYFDLDGTVWETDGTEAGTQTVDGFGTGTSSVRLFVLGNALYGLRDETGGAALYRKTAAAAAEKLTVLPGVKAFYFGSFDGVAIGTRFLFAAQEGDALRTLWTTDGTAAGTRKVFASGGPTNVFGLTLFGTVACFVAEDAVNGSEPWISDGTAAGTRVLKDIEPGPGGSDPYEMVVAAGKLFFTASTTATGNELWVSDGSGPGTTLVKDIAPGASGGFPESSFPRALTPFAGKLFFSANQNQLWKSDGTAAGTVQVKQIGPAGGSAGFGAMAEFNGRLFFSPEDPAIGRELWSSDGSAAGTKVVKDIAPGNRDGTTEGSASYFAGAALGNAFYFAGNDGHTGTELYKRDAAGAVSLVADLLPPTDWGYNPGSDPDDFAAVGGALYFAAETSYFDSERAVWKTDGTAAGTVRLGTVTATVGQGLGFTEFGGSVIFCAATSTGRGIYRTNGTAAGTVLVADGFDTEQFTVWNGALYFAASKDGVQAVYRMSTSASVPARAAFDDGSQFSYPTAVAAVGTRLFIVADASLFVTTDGTVLHEVTTDLQVSPYVESTTIAPAADTLYFYAATPERGMELFRTQTVAGTETAVLVADMTPGIDDSYFSGGIVTNGTRAYFLRYDVTLGNLGDPVLWETDGTPSGTQPSRLVGGPAPVIAKLSRAAGGRVFAAASDVTHGSELWALDTVTAPGAPTALAATPAAASVALSWNAPGATGGMPITDYVVQYRRASVATWSEFADGVAARTTATVTGLTAGANYVFRVIARNAVGDGAPSATVAATVPTPPGQPTALRATGGAGQAVLAWTAPASSGSRPLTDYVIEYRRASVATWSTFADGVSTATTATVTGLTGGANYVFRVTARSSGGDGVPSATAVATILTPPSPPQWVSAVAGQGQATLAWTLPASQGSSPISDYVVQYRRLSSAVWSTFEDGVSTTRTTTVTGLVRGANYAFRIIARSAAGDSLPSGQRSLTIG